MIAAAPNPNKAKTKIAPKNIPKIKHVPKTTQNYKFPITKNEFCEPVLLVKEQPPNIKKQLPTRTMFLLEIHARDLFSYWKTKWFFI